jgi:hypothetical protein
VAHFRTSAELLDALEAQLGFLRLSSQSFDKGAEREGVRIATVVRTLVHTTRNSLGLLDQLAIKQTLRCPQTANRDVRQAMWRHQLWFDGEQMRACYTPIGHERVAEAPWVPFDEWWEQLVLEDAEGNQFTRKRFILLAANKDGGAHVDPALPDPLAALNLRNSGGWFISNNDGPFEPYESSPFLVTARQIGIELEAAVLRAGPALGRDLSRFHTPYAPPERPHVDPASRPSGFFRLGFRSSKDAQLVEVSCTS